tara:strand:- start:2329 stop:3297 length:969 start_codon:yes stop_codon:yes gene_type:complete
MSSKLKILVIRFSSIGDIVLTTPVLRCLKLQLNCDIDYLTKESYKELLYSNTNINNIFLLSDNSKEIINSLRSQHYDIVVDLQNNFRSLKIRIALGIKSYVLEKENIKRYLLIYFGIDLLNNHIVDRYFKTLEKLGIKNDNLGSDFMLSKVTNTDFNIKQDYITWCIGGTYEQKKLSCKQIYEVINKLKMPVVLLGGIEEKVLGSLVIDNSIADNVYNLCGETTFQGSAYLIKNSKLVLTNDTGMMHIAAAFDNPIISFWGCTKPSLGFSDYMSNNRSENIIVHLSKNPCSKHGSYCKFQSNGCIKEIKSQTIYKSVEKLLK